MAIRGRRKLTEGLSMKNMDYSNLSNEELERLVGQGDGEAICELGERCLQAKNYTRAYQLFHKGEKQGLQRAYIGLGEMYKEGKYFMREAEQIRLKIPQTIRIRMYIRTIRIWGIFSNITAGSLKILHRRLVMRTSG